MNLDEHNGDITERHIDDALRSEKMIGVPFGFHQRIERRIRITAAIQRERQAFRSGLTHFAGGFTALLAAIISVVVFWDIPAMILQDNPGVLGQLDYFKISFAHTLTDFGNPPIMLAATSLVFAFGLTILAYINLKKHQGQS